MRFLKQMTPYNRKFNAMLISMGLTLAEYRNTLMPGPMKVKTKPATPPLTKPEIQARKDKAQAKRQRRRERNRRLLASQNAAKIKA